MKIDIKSYKQIDIYYIGNIAIKKKIDDYKNINSVNLLYLVIHSATGYFTEKGGNKYLIPNSTDK